MAFLSRDSRVGVLKSRRLGLLQLWSPITLRVDFGLQRDLKQSCSSRWKLFKNMLHALCSQVNWVDSWLFVVGSQIGSLTPGLSFGHNLCFRCLNEQCEPILDIYVLRDFQWYKKRHKPLSFDPRNCSLKFWESTGTPSPKVGVALVSVRVHSFTLLTLLGVCDVTPGLLLSLTPRLPFGPHPYKPFCLGREPKAKVATAKPHV